MEWKFDSKRPIWYQVCETVRGDIVSGVYKPYEKLPGVRDLAFAAEVNPNTMQRALAELEAEGLLETRGTSGRFVCGDREIIDRARDRILRESAAEYLEQCRRLGADYEVAERILKGVNETNG